MNRLMHPQTQPSHVNMSRGLASLGRGQDTELVHMSNKEIAGLKNLAKAAGGSLTINPHTGLYEAGWLENILPMVAGAALAATGVGAPAAALLVGAEEAIRNKDWKSGLAAGLGAFGGAGLATGLAGAGAASASDAAASSAGPAAVDAAANTAATEGATGAVDAGASGTGAAVSTGAAAATPSAVAPVASDITPAVATAHPYMTAAADITPSSTAVDVGGASAMPPMQGTQQAMAANTFGQNTSNMGQGIKALAGQGGNGVTAGQAAGDVYASTGRVGLMGLAAPAMYNASQQQIDPQTGKPFKYYTTSYNQGTWNPNYGGYGQSPLTGQGYGPTTSSMYTPVPVTFKSGGMIRRYGVGGMLQADGSQPPPTIQPGGAAPPSPSAAQNSQMASYQAMINTPMQSSTPPPATAQNAYLAGIQNQLVGKAAVPTKSPTPLPGPAGGHVTLPPTTGHPATAPGTPAPASPPPAVGIGGPSGGGTTYNPGTGTYSPPPPAGAPPSQFNPNLGPPSWTGAGQNTGIPYNNGHGPAGPPSYIYNPTTGTYGTGHAAGGRIRSGLGSFSDGGQLLRGPGDGVSDSIPATLGDQKAALADGEFVVPARMVSELGNGSTEAGSRKLYAMLDRIQNKRKKTMGKNGIAVDSGASNVLPA